VTGSTPPLTLHDLTPDQLRQALPAIAEAMAEQGISVAGVGVGWIAPAAETGSLGRCTSCGRPYSDCEEALDSGDYTTDANGNHDGLCCEDCQHLAT
jgi:hypothetical protein